MRFGFGGHVEGAEPHDPQAKPAQSQTDSAMKNAAE
jgi:hypothetical protein